MSEPVPDPAGPGPESRWQRLRRRWWARWLMDGALALAIFFVAMAFQGRDLIGSGQVAPDFTLPAMEGQARALSDMRGKKTLLVFWAPWCGVCGAESGTISSIARSGDEGVEVLSVVLGYDGRDTVRRFMDEHEVDYPVLLGDDEIAEAYAVNKFPTLYVIDEEGRIEHADVGYTTELGLRLRLLF